MEQTLTWLFGMFIAVRSKSELTRGAINKEWGTQRFNNQKTEGEERAGV
jgi:hypothetical protein